MEFNHLNPKYCFHKRRAAAFETALLLTLCGRDKRKSSANRWEYALDCAREKGLNLPGIQGR